MLQWDQGKGSNGCRICFHSGDANSVPHYMPSHPSTNGCGPNEPQHHWGTFHAKKKKIEIIVKMIVTIFLMSFQYMEDLFHYMYLQF